eukprot:scaffold216889_cov30-Tisochrysis_lutea.AAC.2
MVAGLPHSQRQVRRRGGGPSRRRSIRTRSARANVWEEERVRLARRGERATSDQCGYFSISTLVERVQPQ